MKIQKFDEFISEMTNPYHPKPKPIGLFTYEYCKLADNYDINDIESYLEPVNTRNHSANNMQTAVRDAKNELKHCYDFPEIVCIKVYNGTIDNYSDIQIVFGQTFNNDIK